MSDRKPLRVRAGESVVKTSDGRKLTFEMGADLWLNGYYAAQSDRRHRVPIVFDNPRRSRMKRA